MAQLSSADLHLDGILTISVWFPRTLDSSAENRGMASSRCSPPSPLRLGDPHSVLQGPRFWLSLS